MQQILENPLLAALGALVLLAVILAPAALRVAGLTGGQIIELLKATMQFIVEVVRSFRSENKSNGGT